MTTQTAIAPHSDRRSRRSRPTAPAVVGIAYAAAWVTGLAVWPSNLEVAASGAKVVSLPLLLVWVAATGITLGQASRSDGRCHARA
jgi:hypothetical protein